MNTQPASLLLWLTLAAGFLVYLGWRRPRLNALLSRIRPQRDTETRDRQTLQQGPADPGFQRELPAPIIPETPAAAAADAGLQSPAVPDWMPEPAQLRAISVVDVRHSILSVVQSLQPYAELRGIQLETHLQDRLHIEGQPDEFTECLSHLCMFGMKSMQRGGLLQLAAAQEGSAVCIDILDNGTGLTPAEISRLGRPFYSADRPAGQDLQAVYSIIRRLHGRIDVTSEVGRGTCFSILLPSQPPQVYH